MSGTPGRAKPLRAGLWIRTATRQDAGIVRELDDLCFPADSLDRQRAEPGELEAAAEVGDVRLLENTDGVVGYVHADTTDPQRVYVSGLAVHPDHQRQGLGTWLIEECLASMSPALRLWRPVVTVTSPRNHGMLRVLLGHGFGARWLHRDHFGPGKDRFGLQLRRGARWTRSKRRWLWTPDLDEVFAGIEGAGLMVRSLMWRAGVPHYALTDYDDVDFPAGGTFP